MNGTPTAGETIEVLTENTSTQAHSISPDRYFIRSAFIIEKVQIWRATYYGAVIFNFCAFLLPALYGTLSKLWIAKLDATAVVTSDIYTYMGIFTEIINEGLSRVAYNVIGSIQDDTDQEGKPINRRTERLTLCHTLIAFQATAGLVLSLIFVSVAPQFASAFVPTEVREASIDYVRIASFSSLFGVIEYAIQTTTRSLDRPDVPLMISSCKVSLNIILDLIFLSSFRVGGFSPTVNTQGIIRLACDGIGAATGLAYFLITTRSTIIPLRPTLSALKRLALPARFTFAETAIRNGLYLWLTTTVINIGVDYATAWGVFNTIRWGLIMVPSWALESAALAFCGHRWGAWLRHHRARQEVIIVSVETEPKQEESSTPQPPFTPKDVLEPALRSAAIVFCVEGVLAILLSLWLVRPFAFYLSNSDTVANLTERMFRSLDWTYILFTVQCQFTALLLATRLDIWFLNSLASNVLWVFPWCIVLAKVEIPNDKAWVYHAIIFGGSLVCGSVLTILFIGLWWWAVRRTPQWRLRWLSALSS
ncbi:hypothetical protein HDU85_003472 [Gaertneriomyces sp. JEL0708]|nr:hypothetical protein HDU85_003472 [Gaertneriomyces sp. JEL0708]